MVSLSIGNMTHAPPNAEPTPERDQGQPSQGTDAEHATASIRELLERGARLAAEEGSDLDEFMSMAWNAFVDARPGLRAHIEAVKLSAQLEELRKAGRMPLA